MQPEYRKELIQVAASCLAAAQVDDCDTTCLGSGAEGLRGRLSLEKLLDEVREERRRQELKWGARDSVGASPTVWLAIIVEEVGEVAEEIEKATPFLSAIDGIAPAAARLGRIARGMLESPEGPY